jgi:glycerophosphoryl diester phosphodiesterase
MKTGNNLHMDSFLGKQRPLVIAHRGASASSPEMTMAAYLQAVEDKSDGFECDVQLSKDLIPVCFHDSNLSRTSNGSGRLGTKSYSELVKLDFGSWFGVKPEKFTTREWHSLLTLTDLAVFVSQQNSAPILLVETKHISKNGIQLESRALEVISKFDLVHRNPTRPRAALMSFSIPGLKRARRVSSDVFTVLLIDRKLPKLETLSNFIDCDAWGLGVHLLRTNPELVVEARSLGKQVFVWTVNSMEQLKLCIKYKVDVIITDYPKKIKLELEDGAS